MSRYHHFQNSFDLYTDLIQHVNTWQQRYQLSPLVDALDPYVSRYTSEFSVLQRRFLDSDPVAPIQKGVPFTSQSEKRDVRAAMRRYALSSQPRGVNMFHRDASGMPEHVEVAKRLQHPSQALFHVLDPSWEFVFAQYDAAFRRFGTEETWQRALSHRSAMMDWVRAMARELEPLRHRFSGNMPEPAASIARHVHVPLFYVLLKCVGYKNPEVAFRFFLGSPLVGEFSSPALPAREKKGMPLSDAALREVARRCQLQCRNLAGTLSDAAAAESMRKRRKEFDSTSLEGPFLDFDALCVAIEREMRKNEGLHDFVLDRSLVIASP